LILSIDDDLRGEYLEADQSILADFHMRVLGSSIGAGFVGKVNVDVGAVISVVKELLDSFLDDGNFLLVGSLEELLGHFGLDVQEGQVVVFEGRWQVFLLGDHRVLGIVFAHRN
jgi:hypothetical protein